MTNIPTDLLRTLVAVVELRSFTKAAHSLGVTQPAVSAQIKRLQFLLGGDLLDKSAPGVSLTPRGEMVVNYARRLLSINDRILNLAAPREPAQVLRIAVAEDFAGLDTMNCLAQFGRARPDVRFVIGGGPLEGMLRTLAQGEFDLAIGADLAEPDDEPRHAWTEDLAWVRGDGADIGAEGPVPLVTRGADCPYHRAAVGALHQAGRDGVTMLTAGSLAAVQCAVAAGLGIAVLRRGAVAAGQSDLSVWDDAPLPRLPKLVCGVFVAEGSTAGAVSELADELAMSLRDRRPAAPLPRARPSFGSPSLI